MDYAKADLQQFNILCVNLFMTVSILIAVPLIETNYNNELLEQSATYLHEMVILAVCNLIALVNESTKIFTKKPMIVFAGKKRLITVAIILVFWVLVLVITLVVKGKEMVWFIWIVTSLSISGY